MSVRLTRWAIREAPVKSKSEALVLIALCDEDRDTGAGTWLSLATIAGRARTSSRGAQNALGSLEKAGVIQGTRRPGKTTIYHMTPTPDCAPQPATGAQPTTQTPAASYANPCSPVRPIRKETSKRRGSAGYDDAVIDS